VLELCEALKASSLNSWSLMNAEGILLERSGAEAQDLGTLGLFMNHQMKNSRKVIDFGEFVSCRLLCAQEAIFMILKENYMLIFKAPSDFDVSQLKLPYL